MQCLTDLIIILVAVESIFPPDTDSILSGILEFWKNYLLVNAIDNKIYENDRRIRRILMSCFGIYLSTFES
jgi:hypothetical protein